MRLFSVIASLVLLLVSASPAAAGVTIHFKGVAKNRTSIDRIVKIAQAFATQNAWKAELIGTGKPCQDGITVNVAKERLGAAFDGELHGIALYPHPMSEPLYLVFAKDRVLENFVKTQFAGVDVHVRVIELLHKIQPEFATLSVKDEGEYWASGNRKRLEALIASTGGALAKLKQATPGSTGPIKRPDGRIIDLMR
jgi:hypothetical protein